jgi:hypothetical protein
MSREDVAEVEDLDTEVEDFTDDETDEAPAEDGDGETTESKAKGPKRGELPEGYVTPIGLAKELTKRGLHTNREGKQVEVRPQMVYSYKKNAPKDDPFPEETVTDSEGTERKALKLAEGIAWWERKNARVAERKANAAEKERKKAERAAKAQAEEAEGESEEAEATEAE